MLLAAIIFITLALIFYTTGVWAEHSQRMLKWWHAGSFTLGLICDATGTYLMTWLAGTRHPDSGGTGARLTAVMSVAGTARPFRIDARHGSTISRR